MRKAFRWIWFALGCLGGGRVAFHSWGKLTHWDAAIVLIAIASVLLRWLAEAIAYQLEIPRAEYY